ncbi:MAG: hypothetical protein ACK521_00585 [bacterium]
MRNPDFFRSNLKSILEQTDQAIKSLESKMKLRKMPDLDAT